MRFALIYCKDNPAGKNIVDAFRKSAFSPHIPIIESKKETLHLENIESFPELKNIDFVVFPSIHRSKDNKPALTVHAPGNWRSAQYGGKEGKVCMSSAFVFKFLFQQLEKNAREHKNVFEKYAITMEATHHGPATIIPCCFIEVGSTDEEYEDKEAIEVVTKTILSLQSYKEDNRWIPAIAVGGPHYAPNFNKIQLKSNYAISHIIPSYSLPLTEKILQEAEEKTKEQVKTVLIDWKGCGSTEERDKTIQIIKKVGCSFVRAA